MVSGKHIAVPVQYLAPGGAYLHGVGAVAHGLLKIEAAVYKLPVGKLQYIYEKENRDEQDTRAGAPDPYSGQLQGAHLLYG